MKKKNFLYLLCLFLLAVSALLGCQKKEEVTVATENDEYLLSEDVEEMVIAVNLDSSEEELPFSSVLLNRSKFWGSLVFQGLLVADENINNVEKDLCEEYMVSTDGKTYVFVLRDDVYWHDGRKLTTDDVVFSIETCLMASEVNGYVKKGMQGIVGASEYESGEKNYISGITINDNSITIRIEKQDNCFLGKIAQLAILPKHCLEDVSMEEFGSCDFWKMPVGSGPYKVVSNRDNKEAVLVVNKRYAGLLPKISRIRYVVLEDPENDEFDFAYTSNPEIIRKFQNRSGYTTVKTENLYYRYLYFNLDGREGENEGLLDNSKIRQALAMAIDRKKIVEELYKDAGVSINGGIPETDSWYNDHKRYDLEYDPDGAKELLKQEKFDFSKTLVLTRYHQDELSKRLLEEIAEDWNALGIKTEIQPIGVNETNKLWVEADWYDVGLKNLAAVDYSEWYNEYSSENQMWSVVLKERTAFDVLITALDNTKWAYERQKLYEEIQAMETEQVFKIPLVLIPQHIIYNTQTLYLPEMTFPNMNYYYDLNLSQWELLK